MKVLLTCCLEFFYGFIYLMKQYDIVFSSVRKKIGMIVLIVFQSVAFKIRNVNNNDKLWHFAVSCDAV